MHRVLLVDDDTEVLELNAKFLKNNGYQVSIASNAMLAMQLLNKVKPNCIVLDVMMPQINGFVACKEFRKRTDVPIIFLTGRSGEEDKINGLLIGGDDYMVKPYSLKELSARILVNIRRYEATSKTAAKLSYPPLTIHLTEHKAHYNEEEIPLSNREFELLYYLAQHPNQTITFQQIGEKVWGMYREEDRRSIMVNASRLRKKLDGYVGLENLIETVWSQGYKFVYGHR